MANSDVVAHEQSAKVPQDHGKPAEVARQLFNLHPLLRAPPDIGDIHLCTHSESVEEVEENSSTSTGRQSVAFATRSGDLFLLKTRRGESPLVKRVPWYLDPERAIVALTFDPSGSWLLVIGSDASFSLVPVLTVISGTSAGVVSRHGWATRDITSFPPPPRQDVHHPLNPTCVTWWENTQWGPVAVLGGDRGEVLFVDLATGTSVGSTTISGPVKSLHLCHNNKLDSIFLLITNSNREQWKLLLEQRDKGYYWPLDRVDSSSPLTRGPPLLPTRSRLQGLKQLSVEKISLIKQKLAETRKTGAGGTIGSLRDPHGLDKTSCEDGVPYKRSTSLTPEKLGLHVGETFICPQNSRGSHLLSGYYAPSNLLTVHSVELEVVPLSIHRLPPLCRDVLLTDRFIFVTDHSSVTLTVISCQLSESSIEDSTEYNPESVIQKFSFSGGERVVGLFKKTAVGGGQERATSLRGGGGVKRGTPPVPMRSSQAAAAAALADVNHLKIVEPLSVSGQWANGPPVKAREVTMGSVSVESKETDTCIVVTTCGVYELQLRQCPSELFLDLALKNGELEEAERVAQVFGLNLQHLLEVAGDLELASKSFTQAISFYKLSRCRHLKSVLKFAAGGHSVELLGFIETVFGASSAGTGGKDLSPTERIHLSNLAVMAHVERVLRSAAASAAATTTAQNAAASGADANNGEPSRGRTYSSSLLGKFLRFLHDNQHYDEVLAVSVVGQTALWEPLRFLCSQRGLHREALTSLSRLLQSVAASRSNDGGGTESSQGQSQPSALTLVACSILDPSLWECLSDEALLQPLLERPQLATVHLNFVTSFLSMLSAPCLQRLAVLYDPSSPIFSPSMQRIFACDTLGHDGFKVSSAGSESLEDSGLHHPIEELLEMYMKVMLYLGRKRSGGRAAYFPELMGWSLSKERDAGDDCDEKKKKPAERGRPPSILAAGYAHAALVWNRGVLTWGNTAHGCLGHGPTMSRYSFPRDVASFPSLGIEVLSVSCGRQHTLALTTNGVYAWGSAQFGQIGIGMSSGQAPYPRLVESLCREQVVQVSAGQYHSMALTDDGRVYTWGWGVYGQLGHGNVEDCTVPTLVQALNGSVHVTSICGGHCHSLALAVGGQLMAWGSSVFGQLGHGAVGKSSLPVCVSLPEPVSIVATAYFHNLAVGMSNRLYTWGSSPQVLRLQAQAQKKARLKQLVPLSPQPPPSEGRKPSRVEGGGQAQGEAAETGEGARVALDDVGARSGGSSSSSSESADGESQAHLLPSVVDTSLVLGPITQVSCGCHHSALLTKDGTVYTWGRSLDGQVGNGTRREASIPAPLSCPPPPPSAVPAPSASNGSSGASNSSNNTTLPILTRLRASHVTCGCEFTLALEATSEKLWAWGSNSLAQLGKDLDEDPRSALHGKVVMLKANKRVIKWPQGAQNSSDLPYLVPWLPPAVPLTDAEAKKGWASRKVVVPSGRDDDTAPYGHHALHKALEFFHGHYSSQRLLSCCLELENYQAASKIMALDGHFHQALAYQLKALYLARSSDASSPLDRGAENCRKKTRRVEQESEGSQKRRRDAKATSVPLYNGTSGGCLRCETHSFAIQGGEEEMSEVGAEGCHACGQEAGAKEDLVPEDDDAGSSPLLSASISPEAMGGGEGAQPPVGESPQPSPSPTPTLLWGGGVVDGDGGEELARQASSVVEHYASLLEEEGHQMVRRLLEQGIDFWLAHSLPLGSLESLLVKHMSKFFYPLGLMLFCDGGRSDCGTADDRRKGGVGGCARGEDGVVGCGEKVSSVRGRGTAMGGGSNILSQLSTRFCLQLCSTLLSHIQHKKVAYPEYVELLAQVMAMQTPMGTSRDNGDGVQVAVGNRVLPYDVAPEHAMEAVLENLPSLIGDEAIHVAGDAVSELLLGNGQAGNKDDDNVVTGKGSTEALVFSCGHHFHADRFRQSVLPETELALLGLHHPLPRTARLVKGLFSVGVGQKHSSLQLACPNCVLSHLQAQV